MARPGSPWRRASAVWTCVGHVLHRWAGGAVDFAVVGWCGVRDLDEPQARESSQGEWLR